MPDPSLTGPAASPLQKVLAFVIGSIVLVLGLMFSAVIVVAGVVIGLLVWAYLWWKTREIRRVVREAQSTAGYRPAPGGDIIEGEAVVVEEGRSPDRQAGNSGRDELP